MQTGWQKRVPAGSPTLLGAGEASHGGRATQSESWTSVGLSSGHPVNAPHLPSYGLREKRCTYSEQGIERLLVGEALRIPAPPVPRGVIAVLRRVLCPFIFGSVLSCVRSPHQTEITTLSD